jgi:hypothetical protein
MTRLEQACWMVACLAIASLLISGCGNGDGSGKASPKAAEKSAEAIKRRPADKLPAIGEYLPPLDDGRIEIAPPAEWKPMPRDARYLARFVPGKISELPRITVTAWDTPLPEITELTQANAGQLAAELIAQAKKRTRPYPSHRNRSSSATHCSCGTCGGRNSPRAAMLSFRRWTRSAAAEFTPWS